MKKRDCLLSVFSARLLMLSLLLALLPSMASAQCPDNNHPHMIDLGLPSGTKWACCNVGATTPEGYGDYFAWGETQPKDNYSWETYIHCDGSWETCHDIGSDIAGTGNDAATANWGTPWQMPSKNQFEELYNNCTSEWTTQNGVSGCTFTGPNGSTVFLPAAGTSGNYWTSTFADISPNFAYGLDFYSYGHVGWYYDSRNNGLSVRPVAAPSSDIYINETTFPDENFRNWVLSKDYGQDGVLTAEEIARVGSIRVSRNMNIANLKGIEYFTALRELLCPNNQLTSLDLSKNTALLQLACYSNQLTSLNLSQNTALTLLQCDDNQLTSLDVSQNTALTKLTCSGNQLASLDVSHNTALTTLYCSGNQLISLDVSPNMAFTYLSCNSNRINETEMGNIVDALPNVSGGVFHVKSLYDTNEQNVITTSQVAAANAKGWNVFAWDGSSWIEYDGDPVTSGIPINETTFPDMNFRNWVLSQTYGQDGVLTAEEIAGVTYIDVINMGISDLKGIEYFTAVTKLLCYSNQLTSLDVSKNTALQILDCIYNKLTTLDVSQNTKLIQLICNDNQIDETGMGLLVESLPVVNNGKLHPKDLTDASEQNVITAAQVAAAKAKGWTTYAIDGCGGNEYAGDDATTFSFCPDDNHPHMIDLGLPSGTKWACCNVGATTPEGFGDYFAWGETQPKDNYSWETYIHCDGSWETCHDIGSDIAGTGNDAATANWGTPWQMPSQNQFEELYNNCTSEWTTQNGVSGCTFTGPNGSTVFLPAAGTSGNYWTSTFAEISPNFAYGLDFYSNGHVGWYYDSRNNGLSVRPVAASSSGNIIFADAKVKEICVANWDTNGDGELSYDEAAAVTSIAEVFFNNKDIISFDELRYFTGVTELNEAAFAFSSNLQSITIPKSVTNIGRLLLVHCENLKSIRVDEENPSYDSRDNCNAIIETAANRLISGCMNTVIPNSVESIGDCSFEGHSGLLSITIPNSVKVIEYGAFNSCRGLSSMLIPKSVTYIGISAFANCSGLRTILVENGNPAYDSRNNCNAIISTNEHGLIAGCMSTVIPNSVTSIESFAFCGCTGLTSLVIPNSVISIGYLAFSSCSNLSSIIIPNSVTTIGDAAFQICSSLTSLEIPNSVTTIGSSAFTCCTSLSSITIPESVTNIGDGAFSCCESMEKVFSYIIDPFEIASDAFSTDWEKNTATLYVPVGCKGKYENTAGWDTFANIVEMDVPVVEDGESVDFSEDIDDGSDLDGNVIGDIYYNISAGDGGYNAAEGCIVVTTPTDDSAIDGQDIFGEDFKDNYTGIVFKVPTGKGTIKVEAQTTGGMMLKVKVGNNDPIEMALQGKLKVTIPYDVPVPTYVYIYAGSLSAGARGNRAGSDGELKIYGIEVSNDASGISAAQMDNESLPRDNYYTLDGRKVDGIPARKGVYIVNGRKVVVK